MLTLELHRVKIFDRSTKLSMRLYIIPARDVIQRWKKKDRSVFVDFCYDPDKCIDFVVAFLRQSGKTTVEKIWLFLNTMGCDRTFSQVFRLFNEI